MLRLLSIITLITIVLLCTTALAVPPQMTYQGRLLDDSGNPLTGTFEMQFTIYSDPDGTSPIWTENYPAVSVTNGLFSVILGSVNPLEVHLFDGSERWLGIRVGSDDEIRPLTRLVSVPNAYNAESVAENSIATAEIVDKSILPIDLSQGGATDGQVLKWSDLNDQWIVDEDESGIFELPYAGDGNDPGAMVGLTNYGEGPALIAESQGGSSIVSESYGPDSADAAVAGMSYGGGPGVYAQGSEVGLRAVSDTDSIAGSFGGGIVAQRTRGTTAYFSSNRLTLDQPKAVEIVFEGEADYTFPDYTSALYCKYEAGTALAGGFAAEFESNDWGVMISAERGQTAYPAGTIGLATEAVNYVGQVIGVSTYVRTESSNDDHWPLATQSFATGELGNDRPTGIWSVAMVGDTAIGTLSDATDGVHASIGVLSTAQSIGLVVDSAIGVYSVASGANINFGVYAEADDTPSDWAGFFVGDVGVTGTVYSNKAGLRIDHPDDPDNKYLHHSTIHSSEMKNVYDGSVVTDGSGFATVKLPDYVESLNRDFRYQLTVVGEFAQAIIAEEIANSSFTIRTDKPNVKVCWQVTGIRDDAYARANPMVVETDKGELERGRYVNPEAYGVKGELGIGRFKPIEPGDPERNRFRTARSARNER